MGTFSFPWDAQVVCYQLENSALPGLCSCVFNDRRVLSVSDKVEQRFRAQPIQNNLCDCDMCPPYTTEELEEARWMSRAHQEYKQKPTDIFCCRQIGAHCELIF